MDSLKMYEEVKPFIKWAGGKTRLLKEIFFLIEKPLKRYVEPFVGGGAVLFKILSKYNLEEIYINDINYRLINVYKVIQNDVDEIICLLQKYEYEYMSLNFDNQKEYYYNKRKQFNDLIKDNNSYYDIKEASLFIFLNKTCFNGLYRVNKKGIYNVPMGSYKSPNICNKNNLLSASKALKNVNISSYDYSKCEKFIDKNTLVYIDPPYKPLTATSSFTSYTQFEFLEKQHIQLAKFVSKLNYKGAKIILSNSDPKNIDEEDDFFDILYNEFKIKRILANRFINSNKNSRGKIYELLISNI